MVRHTDRHSILSAYSKQQGRLSLLVPAGNGREAARRRALLMPGSRFSCIADIKNGDIIPPMRDVMRRGTPAADSDPVKVAVILFLVDFINTLMKDSMPDELTFNYIDSMFEFYTTARRGIANFHLLFLIRLMHFAGIEPDASTYRRGYVFDMIDGVFRESAPLHGHFLEPRYTCHTAILMRMNKRNMHLWQLSSVERNMILDRLIEYYSLHFSSLKSMKSIDILRSLFI